MKKNNINKVINNIDDELIIKAILIDDKKKLEIASRKEKKDKIKMIFKYAIFVMVGTFILVFIIVNGFNNIKLIKDNKSSEDIKNKLDNCNGTFSTSSNGKFNASGNDKECLEEINNQIIEYFLSNNDYKNFSFNYIDEEKNVVVVGLLDNSEEEQKIFREKVVDSNLILFVQGCKFEDLEKIQNDIANIVSSKDDYTNFASCGIDYERNIIIVELIDNSKEEQDWFRKNIISSQYIEFRQGGPYYTSYGDK